MIKELFLNVLGISVPVSLLVAVLLLLTPFTRRRYAARWMYRIWVFLALWLVFPWGIFLSRDEASLWSAAVSQGIQVRPGQPGFSGEGGLFRQRESFPEKTSFGRREFLGGAGIPGQPEISAGSFPGAEPDKWLVLELPAKVEEPVVPKSAEDGRAVTWLDAAAFVWLAGVLAVWSVYLSGYFRCRGKIRRAGKPIKDDDILCRIEEARCGLRIKYAVCAAEYSQAVSPMVIGFLHPVLILPDTAYGPEELGFILKHELVHLKRRDTCVRLLMAAAGAVHWFNPLIWLMQKEAAVDMELSCDELVVQGADYRTRRAYTEVLLSTLHKSCKRRTALSTQFYGGKNVMKKRFENILAKTGGKNGGFLMTAVVCAALGIGTLAGCSVKEAGIAVDYGLEVRTDLDGDGKMDRVRVQDIRSDDRFYTQLSAVLNDGTRRTIEYRGEYASYIATGDLTGNGRADVLLTKCRRDAYGTVEISVLSFEDGIWKERPAGLTANPEIELYQPDRFDSSCEDDYVGAAVIESRGRTFLRLIIPRYTVYDDETVECVDVSWQEDGWQIESVQEIENYFAEEHGRQLLGDAYEMYAFNALTGTAASGAGQKQGIETVIEDLQKMLKLEQDIVAGRTAEDLEKYLKEAIAESASGGESRGVDVSPEGYSGWRISSLEHVYTYEDLDGVTLQIYCMNYEMLAKNPDKVILAGGMSMDEDGFVVPEYPNSNYLIFRQDGENLTYLTDYTTNDTFPGDENFTRELQRYLSRL